jgi:hypothetical protein
MKPFLITLFIAAILSLSAFTTADVKTVEVKYKVENTLDYWQGKINLIEFAKDAIKKSDIPSKVASPLNDSLSAFENEIVAEVRKQMPQQKDSTKK